jgi:hypothetical protein
MKFPNLADELLLINLPDKLTGPFFSRWVFMKQHFFYGEVKGNSQEVRGVAGFYGKSNGNSIHNTKNKLRGLSPGANYTERPPLVGEASANVCG